MNHKYGTFDAKQFKDYKTQLHKKLFWLLLYQDPKTKDQYPSVNIQKYFKGLMYELDGLNHLLFYPKEMITLCSKLEKARTMCASPTFDWEEYRCLILDAHTLVDNISDCEV